MNHVLVIDETMAHGGIVHETYKRRTSSSKTTTVVVTHDQHPALTKAMNALVSRADYICRKSCARTQLGWLTTHVRLSVLQEDYKDVQERAVDLNATATRLGFPRRVRTGLAVFEARDPQQAQRAVVRTAYYGLISLADILASQALRDGKLRSPWRPALLRLQNIEQLLPSNVKNVYLEGLREATAARQAALQAAITDKQLQAYLANVQAAAKRLESLT